MRKIRTWLRGLVDDPGEAAIVLAILAIVIAVGGYAYLYGWGCLEQLVNDFYANLATELFSVAITVLIIDRLYARRSENEEKQRIIRQLTSPSNDFALEALRLCGEGSRNWLTDGSLEGAELVAANLKGTNLEGANLTQTNLQGADLSFANLEGANLTQTNLEGANLTQTNLQGANLEVANLFGANLEGANLFGANLEGAYLFSANLKGASLGLANLEGAWCDDHTIWPNDDFDYSTRGVINVDDTNES